MPMPTASGGNLHQLAGLQGFVHRDDERADDRADPDKLPIKLLLDHAARKRRNQSRLRRGQWLGQ